MKRAITVAPPFYGYGGQLHRYFKGYLDFKSVWLLEIRLAFRNPFGFGP
jgi:hypothetical protein